MSKPITVIYLAWLRERMQLGQESLVLPQTVETVSDLINHLSAQTARHRATFENRRVIRYAVNQEFVDPSHAVAPGDEVAFFPPVTGG